MQPRDHLDEYLEICRRIYEARVLDGTWPWFEDSTNPEDVIDSDHSHTHV